MTLCQKHCWVPGLLKQVWPTTAEVKETQAFLAQTGSNWGAGCGGSDWSLAKLRFLGDREKPTRKGRGESQSYPGTKKW